VLGWAFLASLALHSLIAAYLMFGLPMSLLQPQKEEAIAVELVPPPERPSKAKAEPPPPAREPTSEKPKQAEEQNPPSPSRDAVAPLPVLRPVFHFGEKDTGPTASPKGNADQEEAVERSEEPSKSSASDSAVPARPSGAENKALDGLSALAAVGALVQVPEPGAHETSAPKASETKSAPALKEAKTLFSPSATSSRIATTAMGKLPRSERVSQLCASELGEQLRHAWPPFFPEFVPNIHLKEGTILDVPEAAFRANRQWYDLTYRCEVDADAQKVVSFAFRVGGAIPKEEWKPRGLPAG
jgi:hypothetical protein